MRLLHTLIPALALLLAFPANAQTTYPDRPIKMIVPLAAASAVDVAARIVTQKMADNMGQQFVILNQPGASGLIGAEQVARAEPDGYTVGGFNDSVMTMVPNLQSKMRWDILKDFEPVSLVATVEWGLVTNNQTSFKSAADLIAAAKAAPGKIDYSSGGPGSPQHLAMAMFASTAGISLTHVPYKGATQAATDVASGQIPVAFQGLGTVAALVRGGQLRLIGVTTEKRLAQFPDVKVDLAMGERTIDMIDEGFDIAIRMTPPPDSSLIVRSLATWRHVLCCSHDYIGRCGRPQQLSELANHNCIRHVNYPYDEWRFVDRKGAPASVRVSGNLITNSGETLRTTALRGGGIALAATEKVYRLAVGLKGLLP